MNVPVAPSWYFHATQSRPVCADAATVTRAAVLASTAGESIPPTFTPIDHVAVGDTFPARSCARMEYVCRPSVNPPSARVVPGLKSDHSASSNWVEYPVIPPPVSVEENWIVPEDGPPQPPSVHEGDSTVSADGG